MSRGCSVSRDNVSVDLIKSRLNGQIDSLVMQIFPNAKREGNEWFLHDISGAPGDNLGIRRTGNKAGVWKDFRGGPGGDIIDLIAHGQCNGDKGEAIRWAKRYLNLDSMDPAERERAEKRAADSRARMEKEAAHKLLHLKRLAFAHFMQGTPIKDTPAELYLNGRHIDFAVLGRYPAALRYHPAMLCPETGEKRPCLLCSVNDAGPEMVTVHRIFLFQQPDGKWTKADKKSGGPMVKTKRAYSSYAGAWINIWRGASGKPVNNHDPAEWLGIIEGVEDGLNVAMAKPDLRMLAGISLSNLGNLRLPACAGVYVCADNDVSDAAKEQLLNAVRQLEARGFVVVVVRPPPEFKDFNEWGAALAMAMAA